MSIAGADTRLTVIECQKIAGAKADIAPIAPVLNRPMVEGFSVLVNINYNTNWKK